MSNTKIVIDKEDWDKIASEFNSNDLPTVTEIQIDQSIEDAAKVFINKVNNYAESFSKSDFGLPIGNYELISMVIEFATSQQIIEQLRVKEKDKECKHCGKIRNKHTVIGMCLDRMKHFEI